MSKTMQIGNVDPNSSWGGNPRYLAINGATRPWTSNGRVYFNNRFGGTYSRFGTSVVSNPNNNQTFNFSINGSNGNMSFVAPSGQTGYFQDAVNTDTPAAGATINAKLSGSATIGYSSSVVALVDVPGAGVRRLTASYPNGRQTTGSGPFYTGFNCELAAMEATPEANVKMPLYNAGTLRNLFVLNDANSRNGTTNVYRKNGANLSTANVAIPTNQSGAWEDIVNTESYAATDLVCFVVTMGGNSGSVWFDVISTETASADATYPVTSTYPPIRNLSAGNTLNFQLDSYISQGSYATVRYTQLFNATAKNLNFNIVAAGSQVDCYLYINDSPSALTVTAPAGQTGMFADVTHTVTVNENQYFHIRFNIGNTIGTPTSTHWGVVFTDLTSPVGGSKLNAIEHKVMRGVGRGVMRAAA